MLGETCPDNWYSTCFLFITSAYCRYVGKVAHVTDLLLIRAFFEPSEKLSIRRHKSMTPIDSELSLRIRIVRVVCIFFMMYVHVNPGLGDTELGLVLAISDNVIVDFLGRASVPALSLISGFLMVHELQRRKFLLAIRNRLRTLVMPMVVWNSIIILFSAVIYLLLQEKTTIYRDLQGVGAIEMVAGKLFALRSDGATTALNFLRDLFVCAALSPLLIYLVRRLGMVAVVVGWLVGLGFGYEPLVYRPAILMFYLFGIYCALDQRALHLRRWQAMTALGLAVSLHLADTWVLHSLIDRDGLLNTLMQFAKRLALALAVIHLAGAILRQKRMAQLLLNIEPRIYFVFLSHSVIFLFLWGIWQLPFGSDLGPPYIVFFLLAPWIALWVNIWFYSLISGAPMPLRTALAGK